MCEAVRRSGTFRAAALIALFVAVTQSPAFAAAVEGPTPQPLSFAEPVRGRLEAGESRRFSFEAEAGDFVYGMIDSPIAGGLIGTTWSQLQPIVPLIILSICIAFLLSRQLTLLSLNEELAIGLGQKITQIKFALMIVIILLAGASVALVGNLAFVGLMIPHIARVFAGTDYRYILPMSAVLGAIFLLAADTLGRTLNAPFETPVAAIVSVLGLPFFLFIVRKGGKA